MKCASRGSLPFMKMLYPRKIDEVLWHSATCRFSKSILVKIPRLPTMRVIGSQFISTSFLDLVGVSVRVPVSVLIRSLLCLLVSTRMIAGGQLGTRVPPSRLLIEARISERAERSERAAIDTGSRG